MGGKPKLPPAAAEPPPPAYTPTRADAMFGNVAGNSSPGGRPPQSAINTSTQGLQKKSRTSKRSLIGGAN